jgi:small subunit ribosomal protein S17|tara:strand:+ start:54 stop:290 length:237 start_codon:yes stop_codon:yes gene_type:complete
MPKKILSGTVVSEKPNKSITVVVERKYQHPVLKKVIRKKKKYNVHDEENKFKNGDKVLIRECKPYSKSKKFEVVGDSK